MKLNRDQRLTVVARAREAVRQMHDAMPAGRGPLSHYCLFHAGAVLDVLRDMGVKACIQAGSAYWMWRDEDDGVSPNVWGYGWEWNTAAVNAIARAELPEMHVWVGIPETQEVIDLTTRFWRGRCEGAGYKWTAPDPPDFLWCRADDMPTTASYEVSYRASVIAHQILAGARKKGPVVIHLPKEQSCP